MTASIDDQLIPDPPLLDACKAHRIVQQGAWPELRQVPLFPVLGAADLQINWVSIWGQLELGENPKHLDKHGSQWLACLVYHTPKQSV
jgi:hypothetical protein